MNKSTILVEIKLYSLNGSFIKFSNKNYIIELQWNVSVSIEIKIFVIENWILNEKRKWSGYNLGDYSKLD